MGIATSIAVFLTVWWTVLLAILPIGAKTYAEAGEEVPGGGDPSAPVNPNLKRKFWTTTWVSVLVFAVIWSIVHFGLVQLPALPSDG